MGVGVLASAMRWGKVSVIFRSVYFIAYDGGAMINLQPPLYQSLNHRDKNGPQKRAVFVIRVNWDALITRLNCSLGKNRVNRSALKPKLDTAGFYGDIVVIERGNFTEHTAG